MHRRKGVHAFSYHVAEDLVLFRCPFLAIPGYRRRA